MDKKIDASLNKMIAMQTELNKSIHPAWENQDFDWFRAIWVECAELMDKIGWKWWKKQTLDRDQAVLELVDIWHFILSEVISDKNISIKDFKHETDGCLRKIKDGDLLFAVEEAVKSALNREILLTLFWFFRIASNSNINMQFDELYSMYAGKYMLNKFRQDNGYQTGEYRKIWSDGREDNEHLMDLIKLHEFSDDFETDVYRSMSEAYTECWNQKHCLLNSKKG